MNHQVTLEELGMIPPTPEPPKLSVPPQFRVVTVYVTVAQTIPSVGITVPGKWTNYVLYAKSVGPMMEKESICGGANVSGTKLLIAMRQQREGRNSR